MILFHWIHSLWWPESGNGYALGSSWMGVNMGMFTVWYTVWRRHNCHSRHCARIGQHVFENDGHHELYCRKHKPQREAS